MTPFSERVIELIQSIPAGRVTTYGTVAAAAGNRCGARQVARLLYSCSESHHLPWHRVISGTGRIPPRLSMGHLLQRQLLEDEGVQVDDQDRVDLEQYLWAPEATFLSRCDTNHTFP